MSIVQLNLKNVKKKVQHLKDLIDCLIMEFT